jgi:predicted nucleotidyltransferase
MLPLINALSEYLTILRREYRDKVVDVLLFGSVARGDYDEESDIDILVVVKNGEAKLQDEISMASYEPMLRNDVVVSSLVMDEMLYNWHRKYKDPLYKAIKREGINRWKKPGGRSGVDASVASTDCENRNYIEKTWNEPGNRS